MYNINTNTTEKLERLFIEAMDRIIVLENKVARLVSEKTLAEEARIRLLSHVSIIEDRVDNLECEINNLECRLDSI